MVIFELVNRLRIIQKNICIQYDEWTYSLELLKRLIRDFPSNWDLICQTGDVCERLNDFDAALEHYLIVDKQQFSRTDVKLKIAKIFIGKKEIEIRLNKRAHNPILLESGLINTPFKLPWVNNKNFIITLR